MQKIIIAVKDVTMQLQKTSRLRSVNPDLSDTSQRSNQLSNWANLELVFKSSS